MSALFRGGESKGEGEKERRGEGRGGNSGFGSQFLKEQK